MLNKSDHDLTPVLAYKEFFGGCTVAQNMKFSFCGCEPEPMLTAARTTAFKLGYELQIQRITLDVWGCDGCLLDGVLSGRCISDRLL